MDIAATSGFFLANIDISFSFTYENLITNQQKRLTPFVVTVIMRVVSGRMWYNVVEKPANLMEQSMSASCSKKNRIDEVAVEYNPAGARVVFLVETTSQEDALEIDKFFSDLSQNYDIISLCHGKLMGYCIQLAESADQMLNELETSLRTNHPVVVKQDSFDDVAWNLVVGLSEETGSKVAKVPTCDICGKVEPFPTVTAVLLDERGEALANRHYCESCSAGNAVTSNKEFLRSLLKSDRMKLCGLEKWELTRQSSQKKPMRFKVECIECDDGVAGV